MLFIEGDNVEIQKFKKIGKSKYKITLDNSDLILYEDIILKYNLLVKKKISLKDINNYLNENKYYEVYYNALSHINHKMRCEEELRNYLISKNYDKEHIDKVIDKLIEQNIINDNQYINAFINDKIYLTNDGPYKIKNNLLNFKIDENLVDEYLSKIENEVWDKKITKIIEKRLKLNNSSNGQFKYKTFNYLINLGYPKELINEKLSNIKTSTKSNIENEYKKIYNKYKNKYSKDTLKYKIYNYLYRKQYSREEIEEIINRDL